MPEDRADEVKAQVRGVWAGWGGGLWLVGWGVLFCTDGGGSGGGSEGGSGGGSGGGWKGGSGGGNERASDCQSYIII